MIDQVPLDEIQLVFFAVFFTVVGPFLIRDGLRQIDTGGTDADRREWLESRLIISINGCRWLLGMPRMARITRADVRRLGWVYVALGVCSIVLALWMWLDVIRWLLEGIR